MHPTIEKLLTPVYVCRAGLHALDVEENVAGGTRCGACRADAFGAEVRAAVARHVAHGGASTDTGLAYCGGCRPALAAQG